MLFHVGWDRYASQYLLTFQAESEQDVNNIVSACKAQFPGSELDDNQSTSTRGCVLLTTNC